MRFTLLTFCNRSIRTLLLSQSLQCKLSPSCQMVSSQPNIVSNFRTNTIARFICTTTTSLVPDNLEGLVDPVDPISQQSSLVGIHFAKDLTFLHASMMDSDPECRFYSSAPKESGIFSGDALLISNAIMKNKDGFGYETYQFLRQFREKLNVELVVEVLKLVRNQCLCVKFFIWAGRQIGYSHDEAVYSALLDILGCNINERVPYDFLREIKDDDRFVIQKLLNVLVQKCCRNGLWNMALEELGRLKDFGYKPTRVTYNALIQVFLKADKLDTAFLIHREMSNSGFSMDRFTFSCFAYSLCRTNRFAEALRMIEMEHFVPDTTFYTKMVSGLCEASLFEEAMEVLDRMRSNSCIPNVITYRILICGCLNKRKLGICKRIINMMIAEGCYPSHNIFHSLVHAYCNTKDYSYAYKLIHRMLKCGCRPGYVVYNILIGGICGKEELPSSDALGIAEKAYNEMLIAGIVLNKINISNFAHCLCSVGKFERAFNIIREMMSKGFIPDVSTYSNVIRVLCDGFKVEKAFLLFEEMKRNNVVPDVYTYTVLIDSFSKCGLLEQARKWFTEMVKDGCTPNVVTYTSLIHAYLKSGKVSDADALFEMMLAKGCMPNIVTYTALIDGHCKAGQIEKACEIYTRMRGNLEACAVDSYFKLDGSEVEEPNVFTYGALVDGLCKARRMKEARDLLDAMSENGCLPNEIIYDALIDGFCKWGRLEDAQEVFTKMFEQGYSPNVYTYSSLIDRLFKENQFERALKLLSKMLENSCSPNVVIYTEIIDALCKLGKTDEAHKVMLKMEEKGCHPNVVTYTAMIDGLGKSGRIEKCLELLENMCSKGCAPNFVTYKVLINHCCAMGHLDEAHKLLIEMKQSYWPRHVTGYRKVIEGFSQQFISSIGLMDEISDNDSVPVFYVYRVLIDTFIKAEKLELAMRLLEEISSSCHLTIASNYLYAKLIESLSHASKVDKALKLYADMTRLAIVPEFSTFVHLIKGLTRVDRWHDALQLSDSIRHMNIRWLHEERTSEAE